MALFDLDIIKQVYDALQAGLLQLVKQWASR